MRHSVVRGLAVVAVACSLVLSVGNVSAAAPAGESTGGVIPAWMGQSTLVQDPTFIAAKEQGRVTLDSSGRSIILPTAPVQSLALSARSLNTTTTRQFVEPEGDAGFDDAHVAHVADANYFNFCTAGAVAVAAWYWVPNTVTTYPAGKFVEPYGPKKVTTTWKPSDTGGAADTNDGYATKARSYLMYVAERVKPPSYSRAGLEDFDTYPTHGASNPDARDALNWEASGHAANWATFFYVVQSNPTGSDLHSHVVGDMNVNRPLIAAVRTTRLPNWGGRSINHAITIVGYDDFAGIYYFTDTCGHKCNGASNSSNGGVWAISQSQLALAIAEETDHDGIIW